MLYGLGVRVNRPLAGLAGLPPPVAGIDVDVEFGALPSNAEANTSCDLLPVFVSPYLDAHGLANLRVTRLVNWGATRMDYSDGSVFVIDNGGYRVWGITPPHQTLEDTAAYFLGPIMGVVLRMRGLTCLHASAVVVGGCAIALVGASGAGKSTTAAAFAHLGYPVLTDDVLALTDGGDCFHVRPAYPRVRLWPESVVGLFGAVDKLPLMTPNWDKRFLSLNEPGYRFQTESLPLAAVYFLRERLVDAREVKIGAVSPSEALMTLVADSYAANYLYHSPRAKEFEMLSRLVQGVSLRSVAAVNDFARIGDLCEAIVQDSEGRVAHK